MNTNNNSILSLIAFGFFLIITYVSFIAINANGWEYSPLQDISNVVKNNSTAEKVLGLKSRKNQKGSDSKLLRQNTINESNVYMYEGAINSDGDKYRIIETNKVSEINLYGISKIEALKIDAQMSAANNIFQISFNNKSDWIYWENDRWNRVEGQGANFKGMDYETITNLKAEQINSLEGFLPGISETLNFRVILNPQAPFLGGILLIEGS